MKLTNHLLTIPAVLLFVSEAANSVESISEVGALICATDAWEELTLDEGHTASLLRGRCVSVADDPREPGHLATADCVGTYETMPDESYKGSGFCTWTDREGNKLFDTWEEGSHLKESRHQYFGGTERYAGASGNGTYLLEELTDTLLGGRYKGTIELP